MSQQYGDVMHLSVFGQSVIILSSMQAISDLLEKRSAIYSDRIRSTVLTLMEWDWSFPVIGYGERWRKRRRLFHQHFNANVVNQYQDIQTQQSRALLKRLLDTPDNFYHHLRHAMGATIMKITYGIDVQDTNDQYIPIAEEAMAGFSAGAQLGRYWIDFLPILRHVPAWVPWAQFAKDAAYYKGFVQQMLEKPFEHVKDSLISGRSIPSVAASMLQNLPAGANKEDEEVARDSAGIAFGGGSDTTVSAAYSFILAMVMHPEVQRKAQAELDAVVGPNQLPEYSDRPSLPYIEAVVKEAFRWQLVTPLGAPHRVSETDEYRGYLIPEGTILMGNAWAILHDPEHYHEPHAFMPERFLKDGKIDPDVLDPTVACFGFGRRICPGRYLAMNSLYMIIASVLHTFDITHALDEDGKPIPVRAEMTSGLLSFPEHFHCSFKPRSPAAKALIVDSKSADGSQ